MDCLKNKSTKTYSYVSRYSKFYYYYNSLDDKYIYGITDNLNKNIEYTIHNLNYYDTLDSLSLTYYGRPDLYWIIADFNNIKDPFVDISSMYKTIKIPSLGKLYFGE